jgi:hypothetical protein
MKSFARLTALVIVTLAFIAGCDKPPRDVTNDARFTGFEAVKGDWITTLPLHLYRIDSDVVLGDPAQGPGEVVLDVPAGSKLRIEKLMLNEGVSATTLCVRGQLLEGPYTGRSIAIENAFFGPEAVFLFFLPRDPSASTTSANQWFVVRGKLVRPNN